MANQLPLSPSIVNPHDFLSIFQNGFNNPLFSDHLLLMVNPTNSSTLKEETDLQGYHPFHYFYECSIELIIFLYLGKD